MGGHKDLEVWRRAMELAVHCYRVTAAFPRAEQYGLVSQIRRAAVSIPSNIAEGHCRRKTKVYMNHVSISLGSSGELDTCFTLSERLKFVSPATRGELAAVNDEIGRMLYGLYAALERKVLLEERG
jgi:four helix bundle protein